MTISKKTSAVPYRLHKSGLRSFQELCRHDLDDFHPGTHIFRHFQTVWGYFSVCTTHTNAAFPDLCRHEI